MLGAMDVSAEEIRVLGCLVEKQLTTPQQYPLTLNALASACNQASNRDPVVAYDEPTVEAAVTRAKTKGLAGFVHPAHGRSALRFRHALDEALGLGDRPLALLAVLMLRGPQTPGELRGRTERMVPFADLREVEAELAALAGRAEPLVARLARVAGQKEDRYAQLLGGTAEPGSRPAAAATPGAAGDGVGGAAPSGGGPDVGDDATTAVRGEDGPAAGTFPGGLRADVERLRWEVERLRAEIDGLRRDLDDLRGQLGA